MGHSSRQRRLVGAVLGAALLAGGILGVLLLSRPQPQAPPRLPVRPVKTAVVGGKVPLTQRRFPGRVQAAARVQMSFEVAGTIQDLPVSSGQPVTAGQVLARLDPRDYRNALEAKRAVEHERRVSLERIRVALERGAATGMEFDQAQASYEVAVAESSIAAKALEDTVLVAPFDGVVAFTLVRQYQKVAPKEPVLSVQDISLLEIVVQLPEQTAAFTAPRQEGRSIVATFDFLPDREFPMIVSEYAAEADPATQTFAVTLQMPAPHDVTILPGMSATVVVGMPPLPTDASAGNVLPISAVPSDGQGRFFVWLVEPAGEGLYAVSRAYVEVGQMGGDYVLVTAGVQAGQVVVAAGAGLLEQGQQVRLLDTEQQQ